MPHLLLADTSIFLGRFHPLLVHLPIGILMLAGALEWLSANRRLRRLGEAVPAVLLFGLLACIPAVLSGYLLADTRLYLPEAIRWHRNAGLLLTLLTTLTWLVSIGRIPVPRWLFRLGLGLVFAGLLLTGHLGGKLTHGEGFLTRHAPPFVRRAVGTTDAPAVVAVTHPDSAIVFQELILPMLEKKCVACHGAEATYGDLDLRSAEGLRRGGAGGPVIQAGDPLQSELFHRVSLPVTALRFMPPAGDPLTYPEQRLLAWWIEQGADLEATLEAVDKPEDIRQILREHFGWSEQRLPYPEVAETEALDPASRDRLEDMGFVVSPLAQSNHFVSIRAGKASLSADALASLALAKDQVTWLDLSGTELESGALAVLADLPHLTRLRLDDTSVDDRVVQHLAGLPRLEVLNLVETSVSDAGLDALVRLPALRRVYLWSTAVSADGVERLRSARPDLEIVRAFRFAEKE